MRTHAEQNLNEIQQALDDVSSISPVDEDFYINQDEDVVGHILPHESGPAMWLEPPTPTFDGLSLVENDQAEDLGTFDAIEVESMEHSVRVTPVRRSRRLSSQSPTNNVIDGAVVRAIIETLSPQPLQHV